MERKKKDTEDSKNGRNRDRVVVVVVVVVAVLVLWNNSRDNQFADTNRTIKWKERKRKHQTKLQNPILSILSGSSLLLPAKKQQHHFLFLFLQIFLILIPSHPIFRLYRLPPLSLSLQKHHFIPSQRLYLPFQQCSRFQSSIHPSPLAWREILHANNQKNCQSPPI